MKKLPLFIQIWFVFMAITLLITIVVSILIPLILKDFFVHEAYSSIHDSQQMVMHQFSDNIYRDFIGPDFFGSEGQDETEREVDHLIVFDTFMMNTEVVEPEKKNIILKLISLQQEESKDYKIEMGDETWLLSARRVNFLGREGFLCSYASDDIRRSKVWMLLRQIYGIFMIVLLVSWIPARILARYLSRPLVQLEAQVDRLAENLDEAPIETDRYDEIGKLARSVERLRIQLKRKEEAETTFIQNVSHELKTPIMVIESYAAAVRDEIYPKGTLEDTIDTILSESRSLEQKVRKLILFNKLDYLKEKKRSDELFSLREVIEDCVSRLRSVRPELEIRQELEEVSIRGSEAHWRELAENLLENQIRHARTRIEIELRAGGVPELRFRNDGEPIAEEFLPHLFGRFQSGSSGGFGLGLAIVKKIAEEDGWTICARNPESGGAEFILRRNGHEQSKA